MILSVENLNKSYKDKELLHQVSFNIKKGQKVSIIGSNGSGKSTLLKILLQEDFPDNKANDKYEIKVNPNIKIGYIQQDNKFTKEDKIIDTVLAQVKCELYEAQTMLNKLGISDYEQSITQLSGGQKRKVSLVIALLQKTDLLILDEPTNHLDQRAIMWLETYLQKYKGSIILVSHDRYFLNKVTTDIFELDNGKLHIYKSIEFEDYLDLKAQRIADEAANLRKNKTQFRKEKAWISRGVQARRTKSKERIERFKNLKNKINVKTVSPLDLTSVNSRIGTKTIELKNITKKYEKQEIIQNFSYNFGRYQRVGILGENGSGKTTLLKILAKELPISSGEIEWGETLKIGYFAQSYDEFPDEIKIIDYIRKQKEQIETINGLITPEKILERFLFPRNIQHNKISTLSGGEKKRLFLVTLILKEPNVLILDEPTNDFDIPTLLILEEYLENFQGIVIVVSHDRYFLNKVVDDLLIISDQQITNFQGNYYDYQVQKNLKTANIKDNNKQEIVKEKKQKLINKVKFTYQEKEEFKIIDEVIENLEQQITELDKEIIKYAQDFTKLNVVIKQREELEQKLMEKQERWFYLNEKNEQLSKG
ncbi:MAG: ABC-F family ATP-binding cassette domain-containing protein [Mycoplasmatales bacterium]